MKVMRSFSLQVGMVFRDSIPTRKLLMNFLITPHNFHLINQNGMIQSFPWTFKSRKSILNFFHLKVILKKNYELPKLLAE